MNKKAIAIDVVDKSKRLDDAIDHLVKFTFDDESIGFLPLRISRDEAISLYIKNEQPVFIQIDKKRTVKACAKSILKSYPQALCSNSTNYYLLNEDDRIKRKDKKLASRKWKIHAFAFWPDGYFVIRLSCSRLNAKHSDSTQFVLHPSTNDLPKSPKYGQLHSVFLRHGTFNTPVKIDVYKLLSILRHESDWRHLSALLCKAEYGYNTEAEAKFGYEHLIRDYSSPPIEKKSTGKSNSVRQVKPDNELRVEILDYYKCYEDQAWLLSTEDSHYIMRTDKYTSGVVKLIDHSSSTALSDPKSSALQLIAQLKKSHYKTSKVEIDSKWEKLIEDDLNFRYFSEQLNAHWIINEIALKENKAVSILAQCVTTPSLATPFLAKQKCFRVLNIVDNKVIDPSATIRTRWRMCDLNKSTFEIAAKNIINDTLSEIPKELYSGLRMTRGYHSEQLARQDFTRVVHDSVVVINGGCCPINSKQSELLFEHNHLIHRNKLLESIEKYNTPKNKLALFDKKVESFKQFPIQLLLLMLKKGLIKNTDLLLIDSIKSKYRYEKEVDEISVSKKTSEIETKIEPDTTVPDKIWDKKTTETSTPNSNAGRKRIYKDDKERKRIWARNKRKELKEVADSNGLLSQRGRQRIYIDNKEKQQLYRLRNKYKNLGDSTAIVLIDIDVINAGAINKKIKAILSVFDGDVYFVSRDINDVDITSQRSTINSLFTPVKEDNILIKNEPKLSLEAYEKIIKNGIRDIKIISDTITPLVFEMSSIFNNSSLLSFSLEKTLCKDNEKVNS